MKPPPLRFARKGVGPGAVLTLVLGLLTAVLPLIAMLASVCR
jgi:hypothetical protein